MRFAALMLLMAACGSDPHDDACPPVACNSCELGFYGPDAPPAWAKRLLVESTNADASATVWFVDDNGTEQEHRLPSMPRIISIPPNTSTVTITGTSPMTAPLFVRYAPCER